MPFGSNKGSATITHYFKTKIIQRERHTERERRRLQKREFFEGREGNRHIPVIVEEEEEEEEEEMVLLWGFGFAIGSRTMTDRFLRIFKGFGFDGF